MSSRWWFSWRIPHRYQPPHPWKSFSLSRQAWCGMGYNGNVAQVSKHGWVENGSFEDGISAYEISICSHISFTEGQWIPGCQAPVFFDSQIFGGAIHSKKGSLATISGLFQGHPGWWIITCAKFGWSPANMFAQTAKTQTCFSSLNVFFFGCMQCYKTSRSQEKLPISTGWPNFLKHRQSPPFKDGSPASFSFITFMILLFSLFLLGQIMSQIHITSRWRLITHTHTNMATVVLHLLRWKGNSFFRCLSFFLKGFGRRRETSRVSGFPSLRFHRWNPLWHADRTNGTRRWAVHRQQSTMVAASQCFDSTRVVEPQLLHRWQVVGSWMTLPRIIVPVVFSGTQSIICCIDLF